MDMEAQSGLSMILYHCRCRVYRLWVASIQVLGMQGIRVNALVDRVHGLLQDLKEMRKRQG